MKRIMTPLRLTQKGREQLVLALHCAIWWEESLLDTLSKVEDRTESHACERNIKAFTRLLDRVNQL